MKENKTAILIISFVIILFLFLFFVPLENLFSKIPLISKFYNNTTLEIVTQKGKAKVWIDGKDYGETPSEITDLPEGKYLIELEKITDDTAFYKKHSFQIELTKNTSARIDLEIGPEDLLQGSILYYTPTKVSSDDGFLTITSNAEDAKIYIDKEFIKRTPVSNIPLKNNQYEIKITSNGYENVEIPIFIRSKYQLNLKTYHFPIPVVFNTLEGNNE
ncbi:MAG: PEGA domain-containing protein [Candidatus Dojkabacteria bacterium]